MTDRDRLRLIRAILDGYINYDNNTVSERAGYYEGLLEALCAAAHLTEEMEDEGV